MNINSSSNYMEDIFSFNQPIPKEGQQQHNNNQRKLSDADDDDLYAILGCHYSASTEQITAEYRARALELHPDKCSASSDGETERKFCRLQRAKEILLDEERRRDYDRWRDSGLAVTYRKWCELNAFGGLHNSIHWFSASGGRDRKPALMDINSRGNQQQQQFPELPLDPRLQDPRFVQNPSKSCIIESEFRRSTGEKTCPLLKQFRNYEI